MPRYQEITLPSDIRTEHSLHVFQTHQSWLGQSLPGFVFVYFHFNVTYLLNWRSRIRQIALFKWLTQKVNEATLLKTEDSYNEAPGMII